jgi:hypothetical protein
VPHLLSAREAQGVNGTRPSVPARHDFRIYPGKRHRLEQGLDHREPKVRGRPGEFDRTEIPIYAFYSPRGSYWAYDLNSMKEFSVSVGVDHINAISRARKPVLGIAELIWNALDADATRVRVIVTPTVSEGSNQSRLKTTARESHLNNSRLLSVNWATPGNAKLLSQGR